MKTNKLLSVVLTLCVLLAALSLTALAADGDVAGYDVDASGNVTISTAEGLFELARQVNEDSQTFAGKTVTLANDIDLENKAWEPIGSYSGGKMFKGTFDGQGHTVSGMYIEKTATNTFVPAGVGFFGKTYTATVKNLTVEGTVVANGCNYVGGLVGHGYATLENCTFKGSVGGSGSTQVGGIAGSGGFNLTNCAVYADVHAGFWAGGLVGNCQDGGAYTGCYVEGEISSDSTYWGGGAAGLVTMPLYPSQVISGCYSNTVVKIAGEKVNFPIIGAYNNPLDYNGYTGGLKIYDNSWNKQKNANDTYPLYAEQGGVGGVLMEDMDVARDNGLIMLADDLNYVEGDLSKVRIMSGSAVQQSDVDALAVASVGDAKYTTLAEALNAATAGQTVKLLADATIDAPLTIGKAITLDLGGKTLTSTWAMAGNASGEARYALLLKADVTVKNGTFAAGMARAIGAYGALTLEKATVSTALTNGNACVALCANAKTYAITDTMIDGAYALSIFANDATVTITGSTLTGNGNVLYHNGSNYGLKLTVSDTTITSTGSCGVYISGSTYTFDKGGYQQASFTNCTITGKTGVEVKFADLTLDNCTVAATDAPTYSQNNNGPTSTGFAVISADNAVNETAPKPQGTIQVTGTDGKYTGPVGLASLASVKEEFTDFADKTVKISGGSFSHAVPEEYCADGFIPTKNADDTYGVKESQYVAEVKGKKYETLQAAVAEARNATVTLLADTTENVTITAYNVTIDLNGFTLNGSTGERKPALTVNNTRVFVKDSSEAQTGTIKRDDTAENSGISSHYVIDVQGKNGFLKFEGGNVTNGSGAGGTKGASLVRIGSDSVEGAYPVLTIVGGKFTQDNFIVIKVDQGTLYLNGGEVNSANSYAVQNWYTANIKDTAVVNGAISSWTYGGGPGSTTTISGGTINGDIESISYDGVAGKPARVSITGGTVNGTLITGIYNSGAAASKDMATIEVTAGTFGKDPAEYVVEGATVTKNSEGKFGVEKAYLAKVGNTSYYTMDEAFKAQTTSGEPVVLLRDYTTGGTFNSGSIDRTVDLNGHTWTYTGTDFDYAAFEINYPNVTLTVKNGTVISSSMLGLIPSAMSDTITYDNSGLVFEKVVATANGHSGIETNGNNTNDTVTLKNSTLNVPNGFGIYFPSSGTLTIDNSTINAKTMGVQVCAGSLSINKGSAIAVTGDAVTKTENDGAIEDGAAISIVNRTGYKGLDKVTVTGGTFTAKGDAIKAYNWANANESDFTAEAGTVAVSGGTFSSAVPEDFCATGYEPVAKEGSMFGVQLEKDIFGAGIGIVNQTKTAAGKYPIDVYFGIDSLNYKVVGFEYIIKYNNVTQLHTKTENRVVYSGIKGKNTKGGSYTFKPEQIGTNVKYIYGQQFLFSEGYTSDNAELRVRPYATTLSGDTIYGEWYVWNQTICGDSVTRMFADN